MTLFRKFAILLGLLASTIIVGLGVALVFGVVLEREISEPFRATTGVLADLGVIKRSVERLELEVASGRPSESIEIELANANEGLEAAEDRPQFEAVLGPSTVHNLAERVRTGALLTGLWVVTPGDEQARDAGLSLLAVRDLIEAIEQRILTDASDSAAFGDEMRRLHHVTLFAGMLASALFGLLTMMLLRRWVLRPITALGIATERIAAGDFAHRVRIAGHDELANLGAQVNAMTDAIAQMQNEAVERERLAAVGEMVRRLAHNLRNPLAGIRNLAELSSMRSADNAPVKELQGEIITAVDRFNDWLKELLNVTSPLTLAPEEREVRPWLEEVVAAHAPLARMRSVEIVRDFEGAPGRAHFDARRLEHAVIAILVNALQASPPGSRVHVTAGKFVPTPDAPGALQSAGSESAWWEIEIRDEGPGIDESIREKIFRPYFTTKRDGNGIGLASALQIVKRHGGRIDFQTQSERGTRFWVRIPVDPPRVA